MVDCVSVTQALVVRAFLILHVFLCTWRVTVSYNNGIYWLLLCIILPLVGESLFTVIKRQGREFSRFTPCFLLYLCAVLPGIWLLEIDRTDRYIHGVSTTLINQEDITLAGVKQSIWLIVVEEIMPYVIFVSRWILPRGKVTREELSDLLFAFIEIGADIMEFFSLIDEAVVRNSKILGYVVLTLWTVAVLQFTINIIIIYEPTNVKTVESTKEMSEKDKEWETNKHEIRSIFMILLMQDFPFAIFRMYIIINFFVITYSLIFFISKNLLIIVLLLYKVGILCKKRHCPDPEEIGDDKPEEIHGGTETPEAQKGLARRHGNISRMLSQFTVKDDHLETAPGNQQAEFNQSFPESDRRLKKRRLQPKPSNTSSDIEALPHENKSTQTAHPPLKSHRLTGTDDYINPPLASSKSLPDDDVISLSPTQPRKHYAITDDDNTKPVRHHTRTPNRNHDYHDKDHSRLSNDERQKYVDDVSLQSFSSQSSKTSLLPSSNKKKSGPNNFQHKNAKHVPNHTSQKKTHSPKEDQRQRHPCSPEEIIRNYTKPSRRSENGDNSPDNSHRKRTSVETHNTDIRNLTMEDLAPGPHVTKISF